MWGEPAPELVIGSLDAALPPGHVVTTAEGHLLGSRLGLDARVLLEEWDLIDPIGRLRIERLGAAGEPAGTPLLRVPVLDGWLVAVGAAASAGATDPAALEAVAGTVAAVLQRRRLARADQALLGQQAWAAVLAGSEDPAVLGWAEDQPLVVVAVGAERPLAHRADAAWERLVDRWVDAVEELTSPEAPARFVDVADGLRVIAPLSVAHALDAIADRIAGERSGMRPFRVGVSRVVAGVAQVPAAAEEAARALELGQEVGQARTTFFQRIGLERLLARVPDLDAADFVTDMLGPLAADTREADGLRRTLGLLLETDFNIAEVARRQFLHYTTVRYRVGLFERWYGAVADAPDRRLDLAVALLLVERGH